MRARIHTTLWLFAAAAGCNAADEATRARDLDPDAPPVDSGEWYRPAQAASWQWQLSGALNTSYAVDAYDVDLFDTSEAALAALHGAGRKVICYFSAGSSESWREDFDSFQSNVLGERWLDP